jgi:hypothetical protein
MLHFYDGQVRRYLLQIIRLFSNFTVKYGDGTIVRVPVMYGDADRQAAHIVNQNSENTLATAPRIAVYISDLDLDRSRLGDASYVGKLHIRERDVDQDTGSYNSSPGQSYTIERPMPTPFTLTLKVDIWSTSTDQKLQILEQILTFFNPSLEIQSTDNFVDWTSLTVVELEDVSFSSRSIPQGTNISIDVATLNLKTPIYLSPPVKVKKLGVITKVVSNIFGSNASGDPSYIDGFGMDLGTGGYPSFTDLVSEEKTTIGDFDILVEQTTVKITNRSTTGPWLIWRVILDQHPGKYLAGLSKLYLRQADGSEVIGYLSLNPIDETAMVANWDEDTFPTNDLIEGPSRLQAAWGSFDAIIDPSKTGPNGSGLNPTTGSRYLILESIGGGVIDTFVTSNSSKRINTGVEFDLVNNHELYVDGVYTAASSLDNNGFFYLVTATAIPIGSTVTYKLNLNQDGPDAWKNSDNSDFIADANDIIEWDGSKWHIVFSAKESTDQLIYQTNSYTLTQYKWNGVAWVKSFEGEYKKGQWRLEL